VHSDDFGWLRWGKVLSVFDSDFSAIWGDKHFTLAQNLHRVAIKKNAAIFSHERESRP
jgi:hypothetical protein